MIEKEKLRGDLIDQLRLAKGWNNGELMDKLKINKNHYGPMKKGKPVSCHFRHKLGELFGMWDSSLLIDDGSPLPSTDPKYYTEKKANGLSEEVNPISISGYGENPYMPLFYYDIEHSKQFYGRTNDIRFGVDKLVSDFDCNCCFPSLIVQGISGCGKSSFLRAGILASLLSEEQQGRFLTAAIRPTDFQKDTAAQDNMIRTLLTLIERRAGLPLSAAKVARLKDSNVKAAEGAVELLEEALSAISESTPKRLVLGIDQFEEILDRLSKEATRNEWEPLERFMLEASRSHSLGLVLTLESTRLDKYEQSSLSAKLADAIWIRLRQSDPGFWQKLIVEPFAEADLRWNKEAVNALLDNAKAYQDQSPHNSLLPLLAIKLSRLFDNLSGRQCRNQTKQKTGLAAEMTSAEEEEITLADIKNDTDFTREIADLVEAACRQAGFVSELDDEALSHFLHPLIETTDSEGKRFRLQTAQIPVYDVERRLAKSFENCRLVVPIGENRLRLTHETILHSWPRAMGWLKKRSNYLKLEHSFRSQCETWDSATDVNPLASIPLEQRQQKIAEAAEILNTHLRSWAIPKLENLSESEQKLRSYCLALFAQSETADAEVPNSSQKSLHIHLAATYGMTDLVKRYCIKNNSAACLVRKGDGKKPIHQAAWNWPKTLAVLLEYDGNPTEPDTSGARALFFAIHMGNQICFDLLLPKCTSTNIKGPSGFTLLHYSTFAGQFKMTEQILDREDLKLSLNDTDDRGWLPLHWASCKDDVKMFRYLLTRSNASAMTTAKQTILHIAATNGSANVVELILDSCGDISGKENAFDEDGFTALMYAAWNLHADCVIELLRACNPNLKATGDKSRQRTPLQIALGGTAAPYAIKSLYQNRIEASKRLTTVRALLTSKRIQIDPNIKDADGNTALALAYQSKLPLLIHELLVHERLEILATISPGGLNALQVCIELRDWKALKAMLSRGALTAMTAIDEEKNTPLHWLASLDTPLDRLEDLLKQDSSQLNLLNLQSRTPLMMALAKGKFEIARKLLTCPGIKIAPPDNSPESALAHGFHEDDETLWNSLFDNEGKALCKGDDQGWTPLHQAAIWRAPERLDWIKAKAGTAFKGLLLLKDKLGRTPLDMGLTKVGELMPSVTSKPKSDPALKWAKLPAKERAVLIKWIARDEKREDLADLICQERALSFYRQAHAKLLQLTSPSWAEGQCQFLLKLAGQRFRVLGESSLAIHATNANDYEIRLQPKSDPKESPPMGKRLIVLAFEENDCRIKIFNEKGDVSFNKLVSALPQKKNETKLLKAELEKARTEASSEPKSRLIRLLAKLAGTPKVNSLIQLDEHNVCDYLRFFCYFVRGEEGPFFILENPAQPELPKDIPADDRAQIERLARPATLVKTDKETGIFYLSAIVWYSKALFFADFAVYPTGMVEMKADLPLEELTRTIPLLEPKSLFRERIVTKTGKGLTF